MFERLAVLRLAEALASHAALRQRTIAENIAHADTPGYKARDVVPFAEFVERVRGAFGAMRSPPTFGETPLADFIRPDPNPVTQAPNGNTVSLEHELARGAAVRLQHELALGIYSAAQNILRTAIGRSTR